MSSLDASSSKLSFGAGSLTNGELEVFKFEGQESISQPFRFTITLVSNLHDIDLEEQIGKAACLGLHGRDPMGIPYSRYVHGVIEQFEQLQAGRPGKDRSLYEAILVPTIYPLNFTRNSRIFREMSTPDIVLKVLQDGGIPSDWINPLLHSSYDPRDFCVQYQESDLNFISRLLEEEGIFYYFEHTKDKDVLVLGDGNHAFEAAPNGEMLRFRELPEVYEETVSRFHAQSKLRPGETILRDFGFKQPNVDLEVQDSADKFEQLKYYYYPGEYVTPSLGKRIATLRLQELQVRRRWFVGESTSRSVTSGYKFTLKEYGRPDFNQEYLVVSVTHRGGQTGVLRERSDGSSDEHKPYSNDIEAIPASVAYRPPRDTAYSKRPVIHGVQSATVVGPSSEEIHCDSFGRVIVQFHWDRQGKRDDKSSCWIRVSQPWGGAGQGGMFIPRIGQEVLVQFLEGDPDRPVIVGRVYNGENSVPHALPGGKNVSTIRSASLGKTGGFNEIKFDDTNGREEMFVNAQYDRNENTNNNHSAKVGQNQSEEVGVDRTAKVGSNETMTVGANQSLSVGGDQKIEVTGNRDIKVTGNEETKITGTRKDTVTGDVTNTFQANQKTSITGNDELGITGTQKVTVSGGEASLDVTSLYKIHASSTIEGKADTKIDLQAGSEMNATAPNVKVDAATKCAVNSPLIELNGGTKVSAGATDVEIIGGSSIGLGSATINVTASGEIILSGGGSAIKISGAGVEIAGGNVKIAGGVVEVTGGIVKIN